MSTRTKTNNKRSLEPRTLSCGHVVTYRLPAPCNGDIVLCVRCDEYVTVGKDEPTAYTLHPDCNWSSRKSGTRWYGQCEEPGCEYPTYPYFLDFENMKRRFEYHYAKEHGQSSLLGSTIRTIDRLPVTDEPPF